MPGGVNMDAAAAERYHARRTTLASARRRLFREWAIVRGLLGPLRSGERVLDCPCGIGPHARRLGELGARVVAADLSPAMLAYAVREAAPAWAVVADARRLPLRDRSVDATLVVRLLHHLGLREDRLAVLREAARVSRTRVVVSFMHRIALAPLLRPRPTRSTMDLSAFRREAASAGLRVERVRPVLPFVKRMWFVALVPDPTQKTYGTSHQLRAR
ncbi:MAG: class I SAM-dependent methyltransferase [Planctomycetes bacterium]|nr:class I SAM-dependent methyltransferase [Planctomycetota bacterium]